ncbi:MULTISPECIES: hypothetical protein [Enterobacteriaceae]|uniref:hypothetical protein n=1 Tax=Enterobacteriaceae TaxID=543 RepID=UPI0006518E96|nr:MULTISPECIES: hypothetical protein [Citrobacter]KLV78320.1 hypothetical protein SK39_03015 [Citrobacter sp. BIDMC107]AYL53387.1 hypothetical protein CUC47_18595 [Citrobacter freundii]EJD6647887.1 hypothetical protein [Citrobacter freundii]EKV4488475.1 hypothetical protein [Citrobacter freundii]MBJ8695016.1 hypothetical protein [Citrobacter freundii]
MTLPRNRSADADYAFLQGPIIAKGGSRIVYEVKGHKDWVLKECTVLNYGPNEYEAAIYFTAVNLNFSNLISTLAKVHGISVSGRYLIMEKLIVGTISNGSTCSVMEELTDRKIANFGKNSAGCVKSLDYATLKAGVLPSNITGKVVPHSFPTDKEIALFNFWATGLS